MRYIHVITSFLTLSDIVFAKCYMIHDPINEVQAKRKRTKRKLSYQRLIGTREVLLILLAFALLALAPSVAQIAPLGRTSNSEEHSTLKWDAEIPSENFPGSAFFYVDQNKAMVPIPSDAGSLGESISNIDSVFAQGLTPATDAAVTAARPFVLRDGTAEYNRALKCLTDALYYEAANEPELGQRAVAQVILNRMRHPTFPNSVCGVIYQGSDRTTGCQFSYSCDGSMVRVPARTPWLRVQNIAAQALAGYVYAPVGTATHYHANNVYPYWAPSLNFISTIGAHSFYSWKGSAGRPSAFFRKYAGVEPFPGPKSRTSQPSTFDSLDPIQLQKRYEAEFVAARLRMAAELATKTYRNSDTVPLGQRTTTSILTLEYGREEPNRVNTSEFSGEKLPQAAKVMPEYQNSGTWKSQPTG